MAVFLARPMKGTKPKWKKYKVAYSGTVESVSIGATNSQSPSQTSNAVYYDGYEFPDSGTPTLTAQKTVSVSYNTASNADVLKQKIFKQKNTSSTLYYGDDTPASAAQGGVYYRVFKKGIKITDPRAQAIAGDYIEDVEDENASAYPDNGPLGLYWYIRQ